MGFSPPYRILALSDDLVIVDKRANVLTHRTPLFSSGAVVQDSLEAELGERLFPLHRLDRKTSGVLLFARNSAAAAEWSRRWREDRVEKQYLAVVRGFAPPRTRVDRALEKLDSSIFQEATTHLRTLGRATTGFGVGNFAHARYSLVDLRPETGRRHQLRRHLSGLNHPIVGDTVYGDGKHNRAFREQFGESRLMLHALSLRFSDDAGRVIAAFEAPVPEDFRAVCAALGWSALPN